MQNIFNTHAPAPALVGITKWLNTEKPLTLQELRGRVVLVEFWTNQCINCIRTLPYVTKWYDTYKDRGFVLIGVHTPELPYERTVASIQQAIQTYGIHYPIAQDNDFATWRAYNNRYWPAIYLMDKNGIVRRRHFGEGEYDKTELAIQTLLQE
jgi:thiol-disulfide isomerase/thioredoxin